MPKSQLKIILLCLLFLSKELFACMPVTGNMKPYINIIKMSGDRNEQLKFSEAVGWLTYTGNEDFLILTKNKDVIASVKKDVVCYFSESGEEKCQSSGERYFDISAWNSYFKTKSRYVLYLKVGELPAKRYVFTKQRVKNTEAFQAQIIGAAVKECEGLE